MTKSTLPLLLVAALAAQPWADSPLLEGKVGIGAGIGVQRYDGTFDAQEAMYGRGVLTYHPLEWLGTRLTGGYGDFRNGGGTPEFETKWYSNLGLDLVFQPRMGLGSFRPYLASGVSTMFGAAKLDGVVVESLDWDVYVPVELGVEYLIADNLSIWVWGESFAYMPNEKAIDGVRSNGNFFQRRDELQRAGIGFSFLIGAMSDADGDGVANGSDQCPGTPKKVKVDLKGCPFDGDKDGVPDYVDLCQSTTPGLSVNAFGCPLDVDKDGVVDVLDKCPRTLEGVEVDIHGCPVAASDADNDGTPDSIDKCPGTVAGFLIDTLGCVVDSDGDGVRDDLDRCSGTSPGVAVSTTGCPLPAADADRDGVADSLDRCPGTRSGVLVDTNGCAPIVLTKGAKLVVDGIVFKTGSAVIDEVSAPVLARAAIAITNAPDAKIDIAGFTDDVGSESSNQKLSERRAASVKAYLVKSGVPASQLTVKGYGEENPVVDNATEANRAENRRIEFHVL